ncbi:MAG: hypothetical protein WA633_12080, partial [Stellaceae bacterium]
MSISDAAGQILYSSRPGQRSVLPAAARALIETQSRHPEAVLQISEPVRADDGQWTALIIRPILSRDGHFDGAAIGYLNLRYFEDFYR